MKKAILVISLIFITFYSYSQTDTLSVVPIKAKKEDKPLKFNLNDDGSHYFQVTFLNQVWIRYVESNPGTTVLGENAPTTFDIGLRRTRIQMFGQISDRAFLYFQFGMNNYNRIAQFDNRKVAAFFHDAVGEYRVTKDNQLKLGAGLTIANGLSRFSQPSIGTILALDVPVFAQATVDQTDLFSRKLSIYARGQIGKIDYRVSLSDPFPVNSSNFSYLLNSTPSVNSNYAFQRHSKQYQTYIAYQFWDKEPHTTPYMAGNYLGKKRVLNIGGGLIYQPEAMWHLEPGQADSVKYTDMFLWSVEGFLDTPLNKDKGTSLTAYVGYFNCDFGPNYLRTMAQMNPANGVNLPSTSPYVGSVNGSGNGFPGWGTGNVIYAQAGYKFKDGLLGNQGTLQPYVTFQRNDFERLKDVANIYDVGVNWLINANKVKLSFDYQNRPIFKGDGTLGMRKGAYILQFQLFI